VAVEASRRTIRGSRGDLLFGFLIVALAVPIGIVVASLGPRLREVPTTVERPDAVRGRGTKGHGVGGAQGYSFDYPSGWRMRNAGAVTKVSSPQRHIVVSVGPGSNVPLPKASQSFIALVRKQYEDVQIRLEARTLIEGRRAFLSKGTATTNRGVRIRIVAVALSHVGRPYLIAGFSDMRIDKKKLRARVTDIARSLNDPEPG
jgi:hypothetical protein